MSNQQSQKRGIRSEDQKLDRARQGYDPLPASNAVAGAFGKHEPEGESDQDLALNLNEKRDKGEEQRRK
jgi:hypothetical protein